MRFIAIVFCVITAATCCVAHDVDELVNLAEEAEAPFTEAALKRMRDSGLWGDQRQNRSSDIVIINSSRQPFRLAAKSDCFQGNLSIGLWPQKELHGTSSAVYGIESSTYLQGAQCNIKYESTENNFSWFSMMIYIPFYGVNAAYAFSSWDLKISPEVGKGFNNQVVFTVKSGNIPRSLLSAPTGSLPKKKPKGNRNKFVKTSKSGSRSRQH